MNKKQVALAILKLSGLKKSLGFEIIDTHVHPLDVMGVSHYSDAGKEKIERDWLEPGILEKLNYGKLSVIGQELFFRFFPKQVAKMIRMEFKRSGHERILEEMKCALIDRAVFVPVAPWLTTEACGGIISSNQFEMLASVDVHNIEASQIEPYLQKMLARYQIKGVKLHPNLQNFHPQPGRNNDAVGEKLHAIYNFIKKNNLYALFHGGSSLYVEQIDEKYSGQNKRSRAHGLLENFIENNESEVFRYAFPVVIAHLGSYGTGIINTKLMKKITAKFDNVHFDTAGCPTNLIKKAIKAVSSKKIIFGSDAVYNKMAYNAVFTMQACDNKNFLEDIFQNNYLRITNRA